MSDIYNDDGETIAEMPLTERQLAILDAADELVVIYHTPQLLRHLLGEHSGSFTLHKRDDRVVTNEPKVVERYAQLQKAIAAARRVS